MNRTNNLNCVRIMNILYLRLFIHKRWDRQAKDETCDCCGWSSYPTPISPLLLEWILRNMQTFVVLSHKTMGRRLKFIFECIHVDRVFA